jgi:hypothetical protein
MCAAFIGDHTERQEDSIEKVPEEVRSSEQLAVYISRHSAQPDEAEQLPGKFIQKVFSREEGEKGLFSCAESIENISYLFIISERQSLPEYVDRFLPFLFTEIYPAIMQIMHGVSAILGDCFAAQGDAFLHLSASTARQRPR